MRILEQFLMGKAGDTESCEDAIVVNDRFVAVLDGTTSQVTDYLGDRTPGKKAVVTMAAVLDDAPGDLAPEEMFRRLNAAVAEMYHQEAIFEKARNNPEYRSSAAVIIYSRARSELWMVGDCQALVDDTAFTAWKDADALLSEVRSMYLESEILSGKTVAQLRAEDTGRQYIRELLVRQKRFQNRSDDNQYAYYVIDGFLGDLEHAVQVQQVPETSRQLVLASDGYPRLKGTLEESERLLREIIERDPLCFREYKSTKGVNAGNVSFDDRAYIRVQLS